MAKLPRHSKGRRMETTRQRCVAAAQGSTTAEIVAIVLVRGRSSIFVDLGAPLTQSVMGMRSQTAMDTLHRISASFAELLFQNP